MLNRFAVFSFLFLLPLQLFSLSIRTGNPRISAKITEQREHDLQSILENQSAAAQLPSGHYSIPHIIQGAGSYTPGTYVPGGPYSGGTYIPGTYVPGPISTFTTQHTDHQQVSRRQEVENLHKRLQLLKLRVKNNSLRTIQFYSETSISGLSHAVFDVQRLVSLYGKEITKYYQGTEKYKSRSDLLAGLSGFIGFLLAFGASAMFLDAQQPVIAVVAMLLILAVAFKIAETEFEYEREATLSYKSPNEILKRVLTYFQDLGNSVVTLAPGEEYTQKILIDTDALLRSQSVTGTPEYRFNYDVV